MDFGIMDRWKNGLLDWWIGGGMELYIKVLPLFIKIMPPSIINFNAMNGISIFYVIPFTQS